MSPWLRDVDPWIRHRWSGTADCRLCQVSGRQGTGSDVTGSDVINPE